MVEGNGDIEGTTASVVAPRARRGVRPVLVLATVALAVGASGLGLAIDQRATGASSVVTCGGSTPRLTVQGSGTATAQPNVLSVVFALNVTAPSASAALSQDNTEVSEALLALATHGVAKKDVQTTNLTLQAQYAYPKTGPVVTGYQVSNTVTATLRHMTSAGGAIDALVGATNNAAQINSLTYSFSNPAKVEDRARASAVHQAVAHAGAMAAAAGRRLGPVCSLTDNTAPSQFLGNQVLFGAVPSAAGATAGSSVPVEAGTQSETDQVTLVYAVQSR
jgi:uncharacterized protein YggE